MGKKRAESGDNAAPKTTSHRASPSMARALAAGGHRVAPSPPAKVMPSSAASSSTSSRSPVPAHLGGPTGGGSRPATLAQQLLAAEAMRRSESKGGSDVGPWGEDQSRTGTMRASSASAAGSLAARFALAAGMSGRGFRTIADIAKPAIKSGKAGKFLGRSPLDGALLGSAKARAEGKHAMSEGELNLTKLYARDHDGMVAARALLVGTTKSLTRLISAAEELEVEAAKARASMLDDQKSLRAQTLSRAPPQYTIPSHIQPCRRCIRARLSTLPRRGTNLGSPWTCRCGKNIVDSVTAR
jgi:hypothetical protein